MKRTIKAIVLSISVILGGCQHGSKSEPTTAVRKDHASASQTTSDGRRIAALQGKRNALLTEAAVLAAKCPELKFTNSDLEAHLGKLHGTQLVEFVQLSQRYYADIALDKELLKIIQSYRDANKADTQP